MLDGKFGQCYLILSISSGEWDVIILAPQINKQSQRCESDHPVPKLINNEAQSQTEIFLITNSE